MVWLTNLKKKWPIFSRCIVLDVAPLNHVLTLCASPPSMISSIYTCGPSGLFVPPTIHKPRPVVCWIWMICSSPGWSNVGEELVECLSVGKPESLVTSDETLCCSAVRFPLPLYSGDLSGEWASPLKCRVYSVLLAGVESFWRLEL